MKSYYLFSIVFLCGVAQMKAEIEPSLCASEQGYQLSGQGKNSSLVLTLQPPSEVHVPPKLCQMEITAPSTHLIYVRLIDELQERDSMMQQQEQGQEKDFSGKDRVQAGHRIHSKRNGRNINSCPLNIYHSDTSSEELSSLVQSSWVVDPCASTVPSEGTIFPNNVKISWTHPMPSSLRSYKDKREKLQRRRLVITALGKGDICKYKNQHTCIQIGWTPLICIAQELLCDGVVHCPPGGILGDENPQFCRSHQELTSSNWERLATEFLKKFTGKTKSGSLLPAIQKDSGTKNSDSWKDIENASQENDTKPDSSNNSDEEMPSSLSQYGPWGYLMLGMLVCGTILTFCGFWECCCKRVKPLHHALQSSPTASTIAPASVVVIGSETLTDGGASPPSYEDLDQPPSYIALFPEKKILQQV